MTNKNDSQSKLEIDVAVILSEMATVKSDVKDIKTKLENNYATKEWVISEYGNTKKIVNGLIVTVLTEVLIAVLAFVIFKK